MRNTSVQFRGEKQVLKAYETNGMAPWCLMWTPKDIMCKYEGDDLTEGAGQLRQAFALLVQGGSEGTYTLRCYEDLRQGEKINSSTPYSASFNFGLYDYAGNGMAGIVAPYEQRQSSVISAIDERFAKLQSTYLDRLMKKMEEDDKKEKEEKPQGMAGVLGALVENPAIQGILISKVCGWLGIQPPAIPMQQPAAVAGVVDASLTQDQWDKVDQALDILAPCDPELGDHLLALANIAKTNPSKYKMALKFL